ncbi:hypothetical protein PIIN_11404 [Serendipita indica DSM 11827]|uniref:Uncharacterized protein n=1 Tax=Serendipita indica (strain DSM 11827) TaxID=1109443 RepID=G4U1I4_SERID|nr:hypothetical protein PIIN_11404 [Serendipita indica DSM 11827]
MRLQRYVSRWPLDPVRTSTRYCAQCQDSQRGGCTSPLVCSGTCLFHSSNTNACAIPIHNLLRGVNEETSQVDWRWEIYKAPALHWPESLFPRLHSTTHHHPAGTQSRPSLSAIVLLSMVIPMHPVTTNTHTPSHPPRSNSMSEAGQYQAPCHTYDYSPRSPLSHCPNYYPPPGEPHPSLTNARSQSYNGSPPNAYQCHPPPVHPPYYREPAMTQFDSPSEMHKMR